MDADGPRDAEEQLRRDLERLAGDPEAAAVLQCLAQHRFDPAHNVGSMLRACGASRKVRERLTATLGRLKDWVTRLRMIDARRRLCDTEDSVAAVGRSVGYPVRETFTRAFRGFYGKTPSDLREEVRAARLATPAAADGEEPDAGADTDARRKARARAARLRRRPALGFLDPERAAELRFKLRRAHPRLDAEEAGAAEASGAAPREQAPILLTPTGDYLEDKAAASVFGELIDGPEDRLRFAMLHGVRLGNVAAYRLLQRVCRALIPSRPERALLMAELSVGVIRAHRTQMGDDVDQWQALAWTFLAEVQGHAGRFGEAEQSLGFALAEVGGDDGLEPWVEIEYRQVEGALRKRQRRRAEAERALDRAAELGRDLPPSHGDRWQSLLDRLELATAVGDAETGHALANELQELVEATAAETGRRFTLWHAFVYYHRARALGAMGETCCAENGLRFVIQYIAEDPSCETDTHLGVFFTVVLHELARAFFRRGREEECEQALRQALSRYRWLEVPVFVAVTEAELAVLCALRGHLAEARRLASDAAAFFDDLPVHREAWEAARRMRDLAEVGADAPQAELRELFGTLTGDLDLVAWEITAAQARPAFQARKGPE